MTMSATSARNHRATVGPLLAAEIEAGRIEVLPIEIRHKAAEAHPIVDQPVVVAKMIAHQQASRVANGLAAEAASPPKANSVVQTTDLSRQAVAASVMGTADHR